MSGQVLLSFSRGQTLKQSERWPACIGDRGSPIENRHSIQMRASLVLLRVSFFYLFFWFTLIDLFNFLAVHLLGGGVRSVRVQPGCITKTNGHWRDREKASRRRATGPETDQWLSWLGIVSSYRPMGSRLEYALDKVAASARAHGTRKQKGNCEQ